MKNSNSWKALITKLPWEILSASFSIFIFYDTIAVVALFIIFQAIMSQTTQNASLFGTWYQGLLFILDILVIILFLISISLYVYKKILLKKEKSLKQ